VTQKPKNNVTYYHDGNEEGEQDGALVYFPQARDYHIGNNNRQGKGNDGINDNEGNIVQKGIPYDNKGLGSTEKVFKVFQSVPGAPVYSTVHIVPLEGYHNPKHGNIVIDGKIREPRQHHYIKQTVLQQFRSMPNSIHPVFSFAISGTATRPTVFAFRL
jgi:hypothetical protein